MFDKRAFFISKKNSRESLPKHDLVSVIFNDLKDQLKGYKVHYELKVKLKLFSKYSYPQKRDAFPGIYLEIEDFLLQQKEYASKRKIEFREALLLGNPSIQNYKELYTVFLGFDIQKVSLSRLFLNDALIRGKELLGNYQDSFLVEAEKELQRPYEMDQYSSSQEIASKLKELVDYSNKLQAKLSESLGNNAMLNIYNATYNKHFNNYYLLESFTAIINLVPEDLLVNENANMPSKGQMHRLLKTQISTLEEINNKLRREVVERKNIQKELERNERLYSAVLHNSINSNIIMDKVGTIIRWNTKAQEMFGEAESLFELLPEVFNSDLKERLKRSSLKELKQLAGESFDFTKEHGDNTYYYTLKTSPVFVDDEVLFYCVVTDVTKEKASIKYMQDARHIAEKSAQVKSTFLSNMSHEIRTPLNVILGLSELFTKSSFSGSKKELENIDVIKFSAENLLTLVNDILDFSKIEAGKLNIQEVDFNFYEVIENLTTGFSLKATEKGLKHSTVIDKKIPKFIVGDQFRLSQILNNLLSNAIKFTRKGEVSLNISLADKSTDDVELQFDIKDTGVGIDQKHLKNIYESFYQTISDKGEKPLGTGLGLSITKQLVAMLGGNLTVESKVKKGTTFSFTLSYPISELTEMNASKLGKGEDDTRLLKNKHILVAEDNKLNQLFIKQLLSKWEAKVTIANNGLEALEAIEQEEFDLVLMDVHMPIMNGLTATEKIRHLENKVKSNLPIVACSADVFPESRRQAEEAGVDFYITKPVNKQNIKEILFLFTKN